nr:prepilin-type N-terminal cleavage/methylation domain-containing protein [Lachnospiraceae bacterium]MBQ8252716.1 prepilin-type N-terminal cleavage/methylation domain-containing protein [Lachnospiraceae bacterium]
MKRNNAGMSIVEIVIVVAIIAILAGVGGYGIGQISGFRARECASKIASSLTQNKVKTLGKATKTGNMAWELYRSGNDFYVRTVHNADGAESYSDEKNVNDGTLKVGYSDSVSGDPTWLNDGENIRLCYDRSSGALCDESGNLTSIKRIVVNYGAKTYTIELKAMTGKIISNT